MGAGLFETEIIKSLELQAPQGRWEEYGKDTNCSADVKVRPDEQDNPKLLPRKHPSRHWSARDMSHPMFAYQGNRD